MINSEMLRSFYDWMRIAGLPVHDGRASRFSDSIPVYRGAWVIVNDHIARRITNGTSKSECLLHAFGLRMALPASLTPTIRESRSSQVASGW